MKVHELIGMLKYMPQDTEVFIKGENDEMGIYFANIDNVFVERTEDYPDLSCFIEDRNVTVLTSVSI